MRSSVVKTELALVKCPVIHVNSLQRLHNRLITFPSRAVCPTSCLPDRLPRFTNYNQSVEI